MDNQQAKQPAQEMHQSSIGELVNTFFLLYFPKPLQTSGE